MVVTASHERSVCYHGCFATSLFLRDTKDCPGVGGIPRGDLEDWRIGEPIVHFDVAESLNVSPAWKHQGARNTTDSRV